MDERDEDKQTKINRRKRAEKEQGRGFCVDGARGSGQDNEYRLNKKGERKLAIAVFRSPFYFHLSLSAFHSPT